MIHPKYKRQTDYYCCTGTVHCNYCIGQNKPPRITVDRDYTEVFYKDTSKEPINELTNIMNDTLKTQAQFTVAVKRNNFIVGSVSAEGTLSFSANPTVHVSASLARQECARLARNNPGKLYIFVQFAGGELTPLMTNVSI